jgi:hypothetical protein
LTVAYKHTPYESPAHFGGPSAQPDLVRDVERPAPPPPEPPARQTRTRKVDALPPDGTAKLIEAAARVRLAIAGQISYHEEQLSRLRAALQQFQEPAAPEGLSAEGALAELMRLAEQLPKGETP